MYKKLKQFKQDLRVIEKYYRYLVKLTKDHQVIGAFNEWILDNYASILEHENMVLEYYGDEKLMLSSKESGDIIWKCLSNYLEGSHFKMSKRNLIRCFLQYQKNNKIFFTYRELLLIRPILSMIAIHQTRILCDFERHTLEEKKRAEKDIAYLEKKLQKNKDANIHQYITIQEDIIEYPIYLEYLNENLHRLNHEASTLFYELNENLEKNNTNLKKVLNGVYQDRINNNLIISNLFHILKLNENLKLETLYEEISETEKELNTDKIYKAMDSDTKASYRAQLVKLAKKQKVAELTYARRLVAKGEKEKKHIGFYLFKEPNIKVREVAYVTTIAVLTTVISYFLGKLLTPYWFLGLFILWIPTSELVIQIINQFLIRMFRPKALPKMDYSKGLKEETPVMVVIPTILKDTKKIDEMYRNLESCYLANKTKHLSLNSCSAFMC